MRLFFSWHSHFGSQHSCFCQVERMRGSMQKCMENTDKLKGAKKTQFKAKADKFILKCVETISLMERVWDMGKLPVAS